MDAMEDVNAWFVRRGFLVCESETDYSAQIRSSPSGRTAASRDLHIWVDLLSADGRLVHPAYGSGDSVWDAMTRAPSTATWKSKKAETRMARQGRPS